MKSLPTASGARTLGLALLFLLGLSIPGVRAWAAAPPAPAPVAGAPANTSGILVPTTATPILPLKDIRIGMKGYGLSVFHGTAIEPFPFEIVSVQADFAPRHGVIWARCTDERMQKSGAVEGMSGSPMFLWDASEPHVLGKGGKLIGAFAFGYDSSLDCYVGIQPIEFMRDVGTRVTHEGKARAADAGVQSGPSAPPMISSLRALLRSPLAANLSPTQTWRARAIQKLVASPLDRVTPDQASAGLNIPPPAGLAGQPQRLMLPMAVGSAQTRDAMAPLLMPLGLMPMQGSTGITTDSPPPGIDPQAILIQPGAVLSIPLAWGDIDLNGAGTVTDVLPDGHVLAFGHPMFGEGALAVPMATGYVHLVMPSRQISFKLANSAVIRGSIVRDEESGIAGDAQIKYTSAPVHVVINMTGRKRAEYHYQVVHHRTLTPVLATLVAVYSLNAHNSPDMSMMPIENTTRVHGDINFVGNRSIHLDTLVPNLTASQLVMEVLPPLAAMLQNPFGVLTLQSMDLTIDVEPTLKVASLVSARLVRDEVAPGDDAQIVVRLQPYAKPMVDQRVHLQIPLDLAEGDYDVLVCDSSTYLGNLFNTHPYITNVNGIDELFTMVQQVVGLRGDAVYVVLQGKPDGVAIGRQPLPKLPSSRRAIIAAQSNTIATPYADSVETLAPVDYVTEGSVGFSISIKKKPGRD